MSQLDTYKLHAVQGHGASENENAACFVDDSEIISQVAPSEVNKRKGVSAGWEFHWNIFAKIPFCGGWIAREDSELDRVAVWADVRYASIL